MIEQESPVAVHLVALTQMSSKQLRDEWIRLTGRSLPKVSPSMLRLALAWELQAAVSAGLSATTRQRLDQLSRSGTVTRIARPGMRLVREWKGKLHIVVIGADSRDPPGR